MHYATERKGSLPARFTESWEIEKDSMQACYQKSDVGCDRANKNSVLVLSSLRCHIEIMMKMEMPITVGTTASVRAERCEDRASSHTRNRRKPQHQRRYSNLMRGIKLNCDDAEQEER